MQPVLPVTQPVLQLPTLPLNEIEQKQQAFKQTLEPLPAAQNNQKVQQSAPQEPPAAITTKPIQENNIVIDTEKRNSLRDFLSANPVLAQRSTRDNGTRGRFFT